MSQTSKTGMPVARTPEKLAKGLNAWRLYRSLTQDELEDKSGVSKSSISQIERNINDGLPRESTLEKLANALGITPDQLFTNPNDDIAASFRQAGEGDSMIVLEVRHIARWEKAGPETPAYMVLPAAELERNLPDFDATDLRCLAITDSTMAGTLNPGDIALVAPGASVDAGAFVLELEDGRHMVRRLIPQVEPGLVRVSCDNPCYAADSTVFDMAKLNPVARVVYVIRGSVVL